MANNHFSGKFLNIGHRGAPSQAPENTIPSFVKARESGADGIELDVALSKDGFPMVFHNYFLNETTDGKGLLAKKNLKELKSLDAGSHFSSEFEGARIPTLEEVIESLHEETFIMIEIKTNFFGIRGIEKAVAAVINSYGLYDRVVVTSFNPLILNRLKGIDINIPLGLLHVPVVPFLLKKASFYTMVSPGLLLPYHKKVNHNYLNLARSGGAKVLPWTVNTEDDMEKMLELGVDGLITDHPDILHDFLRKKAGSNLS